jgi:nicotinamide-nucleotide amidase
LHRLLTERRIIMTIADAAGRVAKLLVASGQKVVFAESCTGGLVSGALTRTPGISEFHCGGVVVYRNVTKTQYLGIPPKLLDEKGPVSREVAELMAVCVLEKTPEATIAVSVTGHLGPNAPAELDGRVFVGIAQRTSAPRVHPLRCRHLDSRAARQRWVVERALALLAKELTARA